MLVINSINAIVYNRFGHVENPVIAPDEITEMQDEAQKFLNEQGINIGKNRTRELIVKYILDEFGMAAITGDYSNNKPREISEKTIKKYQKMRRRGFK